MGRLAKPAQGLAKPWSECHDFALPPRAARLPPLQWTFESLAWRRPLAPRPLAAPREESAIEYQELATHRYFDKKAEAQAAYSTQPKLKAIVERVSALEGVKKHIATRPETPI